MLETINATASASEVNVSGSILGLQPVSNGLQGWIQALGFSVFISDLLASIIIFIAFLILSQIAKHIVTDVLPHLVSKTQSTLDDEILAAIQGPTQVLIIVIGAYAASKSFDLMESLAGSILDRLVSIALILVAAYFVSNLIGAIIRWYIHDVAPKTGSDLDDHLMPFLEKFMVAAVYVIAVVMIIGLFTPITPLIAGLGVFGIAIALAAKEMLSNLFGALAILTDRPYKIGDRLSISGVGSGDVTDIGLRSTRIKTLDNRIVIIPNEKMANSRIVNLSQPDLQVQVTFKVGIGYTSDVNKACAIMESVAAEDPSVSNSTPPRAYVTALGDSSVDLIMHVWVDSYRNDLGLQDRIYRKILARFKAEGIEIPYPIMTVLPKSG